MRPELSIVVPAYNEARRLPTFLRSVQAHFLGRTDYEVIVVDDGSRDEQCALVQAEQTRWPQLVLLRHEVNRGKGAAVRTGMQAARGDVWLFADADGATPIHQERRLRSILAGGADVVCGSRLIGAEQVQQHRGRLRGLAGKIYASIARRIISVPVLDTQCGFKMFTADAGRKLFALAEENGFAFDVELLALACRLDLRIAEVPVEWHEQPGGKVNLLRDAPRMLRRLWQIRHRLDSPHLQTAIDSQRSNKPFRRAA